MQSHKVWVEGSRRGRAGALLVRGALVFWGWLPRWQCATDAPPFAEMDNPASPWSALLPGSGPPVRLTTSQLHRRAEEGELLWVRTALDAGADIHDQGGQVRVHCFCACGGGAERSRCVGAHACHQQRAYASALQRKRLPVRTHPAPRRRCWQPAGAGAPAAGQGGQPGGDGRGAFLRPSHPRLLRHTMHRRATPRHRVSDCRLKAPPKRGGAYCF